MTIRMNDKYVQPLRLRTEMIVPSFRGKISDFSLVHDQKTTPESPIWTETYHAYAPGAGVFAPSALPPVIDGKSSEDLRSVGQHAHNDFMDPRRRLSAIVFRDPSNASRLPSSRCFLQWTKDSPAGARVSLVH
jgi:hypothetical protein